MKKANSVTEALKNHVNKQILLHAAGTHIFCPKCGNILDWSTVIVLSVKKEGKHLSTEIMCTGCTKDLTGIDWSGLEQEHQIKIEVTSKNFTR